MDASTLRWALAIVGLVVIGAIYLFSSFQKKSRRQAAIDTFTREELDTADIGDQQLKEELQHLNQVMQDIQDTQVVNDIKISVKKPALEEKPELRKEQIFIAPKAQAEGVISYHLKGEEDRILSGKDLLAAFKQVSLIIRSDGYYEYAEQLQVNFLVASLTDPATFESINKEEYNTTGLNCFFDPSNVNQPQQSYNVMLKKIDHLVQILDVKVYKNNLDLLTVTDVMKQRENLKNEAVR